jgi:hypothetical protein
MMIQLVINANSSFTSLHHMEVGCAADISEEHTEFIINLTAALLTEAVHSSETLATQPQSTSIRKGDQHNQR